MSASATHLPAAARHGLDRVRTTLAALGAAALGAAPHVLHHAGPLAGAALLAGISGTLLFGALGFLLAIPLLNPLRRRHDSWAVPVGVLAVTAAVFTFSSLVVGPTLADSGGGSTTPSTNSVPSAPPGVSPAEHEAHQR
jgi:hypothetical protein